MQKHEPANRVQRQSNGMPGSHPRSSSIESSPSADFRHGLEGQIGAALERILAYHKAETVAAAFDRKRSTVYRWAAAPEDVPASALLTIALLDPDPEFLVRFAGLLLASTADRALQREAEGRVALIVQEIAPGKWVR